MCVCVCVSIYTCVCVCVCVCACVRARVGLEAAAEAATRIEDLDAVLATQSALKEWQREHRHTKKKSQK